MPLSIAVVQKVQQFATCPPPPFLENKPRKCDMDLLRGHYLGSQFHFVYYTTCTS